MIYDIFIFLLLNNKTDSFSFALRNPLFRMSLRCHTSEKMVGIFNWRNYILGENSLLHYIFVNCIKVFDCRLSGVLLVTLKSMLPSFKQSCISVSMVATGEDI